MTRVKSLLIAGLMMFAGGSFAVEETPMSVPGSTTVGVEKVKELFDKGVPFIDVRKDKDWEAGRIPGAIHLELKTALNEASLAAAAPKDSEVLFYCNGPLCPRTAQAIEKALAWGYTQTYYFRDGLPAWQAAGHPVE